MKILANRKIGNYSVSITEKSIGTYSVSVIGSWFSNHGVVYTHRLERRSQGYAFQIIGMDTSLTESVKKYLETTILKLYKKGVIKE